MEETIKGKTKTSNSMKQKDFLTLVMTNMMHNSFEAQNTAMYKNNLQRDTDMDIPTRL
jgi:hypothetical protein